MNIRTRRAGATALLMAVVVLSAACTKSSSGGGAPSAAAGSSSAVAVSAAPTSSAPALTTTAPSASPIKTPPPLPKTTGAAAPADISAVAVTAQASTATVTQLHDIAVSAGRRPQTIPAAAIPATAKSLSTALQQQITDVTRLKTSTSSPSAQLARALRAYEPLAGQLSAWSSKADQPLPASFFTQLRTADAQWKAALTAVGGQAHRNLLAGVAPLLYPTA